MIFIAMVEAAFYPVLVRASPLALFSLFPSWSLEKSPSEVIQYDPEICWSASAKHDMASQGGLVNMWILFCIN
jgi:hypothetical protein